MQSAAVQISRPLLRANSIKYLGLSTGSQSGQGRPRPRVRNGTPSGTAIEIAIHNLECDAAHRSKDTALRPKGQLSAAAGVGQRIGGASAWVAPVKMSSRSTAGKENGASFPRRETMPSRHEIRRRSGHTPGAPIRRRRIESNAYRSAAAASSNSARSAPT